MPIKFRCEYCQQLIGIAESKAGSLVDCPTCGRGLRVPNRDGTVIPPPRPRINTADRELRQALDELAQLQDSDSDSEAATVNPGQNPDPTVDTLVPPHARHTPSSQIRRDHDGAGPGAGAKTGGTGPISLDPLPPARIIDPPPLREEKSGRKPSPRESTPPALAPDVARAEFSHFTAPVRQGPGASTPSVALWIAAVAAGGCLMAGGVIGYAIGRSSVPATVSSTESKAPVAEAAPAPRINGNFSGTLTYLDAKGQSHPDAGACVLVWPTSQEIQKRISALGLRPGDDDGARQSAMSALAEQGGHFVQTDESGQFTLDITEPGEYNVIGLSRFRGRPADRSPSKTDLDVVEKYFERSSQLLGKLDFVVAQVTHVSESPTQWNHTFGK